MRLSKESQPSAVRAFPGAGAAVHAVDEHRPERGLGLGGAPGHHDALPRGEAVRLHHHAPAARPREGDGRRQLAEGGVLGRGDPRRGHDVLRERLRALDLRAGRGRPEHRDPERRDAPPPVRLTTSAGGGEIVGALAFVDNAVDPATGTILLKARLENADEALWPGQRVDVRLRVAERAKAVVVPSAAVASGQQGDYAYVVTPERRAQLRIVEVAQASDEETVIAKGIAPGELVVTDGALKLRPDAAVELLQDGATAR